MQPRAFCEPRGPLQSSLPAISTWAHILAGSTGVLCAPGPWAGLFIKAGALARMWLQLAMAKDISSCVSLWGRWLRKVIALFRVV